MVDVNQRLLVPQYDNGICFDLANAQAQSTLARCRNCPNVNFSPIPGPRR
jgi:hypothetical protein